ncbi:MAG: cell division protein ZipA C-terminal FtsZ-binding domain-containing protein [Janthinobacterium lividum]
MTDLQTSLIVIGGVIVVGVISYNKWQEFKVRRAVERAFPSPHDDVLMRNDGAGVAERVEPVLAPQMPVPAAAPVAPATIETGGAAGAAGADMASVVMPGSLPAAVDAQSASAQLAAASDAASVEAVDQIDGGTPPAGSAVLSAPAEAAPVVAHAVAQAPYQPDLSLDPQIDCTIPVTLETPLRGEKVLALTQSLRHVGGKGVHYVGLRADGVWEDVAIGGVYHALEAGVQMANRTGALNELEYSEFVSRLRLIADGINAELELRDMMDIIKTARLLHQFIAEYGAQLSVNVQAAREPWALDGLLAALARQGFDLRPDGRLVMPDGDGGALFSVSTNAAQNAQTTTRLTLLLDVPCVAPARDGFGAMVACARSLATRLDGVVVDDGNQPLSQGALEEIAAQVAAFYREMDGVQVQAGSTRALRLFN